MPTAIGTAEFCGDGRGPELLSLRWSPDGCSLLAADYRNPHDSSLRHVAFERPQVVMVTPEEVVGDIASLAQAGVYAVDLGRSGWLASFNPWHLDRCAHYRLVFYDQTVDVICEGVQFRPGSFAGPVA